ncbi:MAG TPA: hypothetical protein VMH36_22150 [Alphaproteobacteria bacterium]|nr:hypothetical protein [Alphaproteobacteria bacterium]
MAIRRKLNIQQLVTLSEVYWDDAAKLAEILEELRSRLEPEAEALFRTVSGRIHLLKTNPAAAREQPPPTQQAQAEEGAASAAGPTQPRRRAPLAIIGAGVAVAAVAAWFLWPRAALPPPPPSSSPGPEVALGGLPAEETPKSSAAEEITPRSGSPRRAALDRPDMPVRSEGGGGGGTGGGGGGGIAGFDGSAAHRPLAKPRAADKETPDPADKTEQDFTKETGELAAAETRSAREPPHAAARAQTSAAAAAGGSGAGKAEAGVAIDEAQLACYRTDSRPDSCGPPAGAGNAPPPESPAPSDRDEPASAAAGAGSGGGGASSSPSPPAGAASRVGSPSRSPPARPAATASSSGGGGAGSAGSGGAGGSPPADSTSGTAAGIAASPAQTPRRPAPTDPDPATAAAAQLPNCPPAPEAGRVVFILDGSVSMGLPLDVDGELEDALDEGIRRHDPKARQEYRALLAEPGPKRITRAREAFAAAAADLPPKVELGLLVFQECRDIRKIGVFDAARRRKAVDYIRALVPHGRTPIADSLRRAAEMLGRGASSIVLLTDGREFCGGDPCAAAAEIKAAHPQTPVSIVDITGQAKAECVAEITGGRSYKPEAADDLARVVSAAFRGADPLCSAEGDPDPQRGAAARP